MHNPYKVIIGAVIAVAIGVPIYVNQTSTPSSDTANLVVATTAQTCTRSATPITYTQAQSNGWLCGTFDAANDLCQNNDTVLVKGGTYTTQTLTGSNSRTTNCTFQTIDGETVQVEDELGFSNSRMTWNGDGTTYGSSFTVIGGDTTTTTSFQAQVSFNSSSSFLVINDWKLIPGNVWMAGNNITVNRAEWGGYDTASAAEHDGMLTGTGPVPSDIILDDVYVHDIGRASGAQHTDCFHIRGIDTFTLRNSRVQNCPTTGLLIQLCCTGDTQNDITIENNFLGPVDDGSVMVNLCNSGETMNNLILRYNTINSGYDNTCGSGTQTIKGNIFSGEAACNGPGTYTYNVWGSGTLCGTNSFTCTPSFVNAGTNDRHLQSGDTCAKSRGDTGSHPATDIDGDSRPLGTVDIGADEVPN